MGLHKEPLPVRGDGHIGGSLVAGSDLFFKDPRALSSTLVHMCLLPVIFFSRLKLFSVDAVL